MISASVLLKYTTGLLIHTFSVHNSQYWKPSRIQAQNLLLYRFNFSLEFTRAFYTHSWKAVMLQSYRCATNGNVNVVNFISQMIFFKNNLIWLTSNTPKLYNTIKQVGSKIEENGYRRYRNQYLAQIIQNQFIMEKKIRHIMYHNTKIKVYFSHTV